MGCASPSSRGSSAAGRAPARKLAESERSISVYFGRATFYKLWLSVIVGDDLWINKEPHILGETEDAGRDSLLRRVWGHRRGGSKAYSRPSIMAPGSHSTS